MHAIYITIIVLLIIALVYVYAKYHYTYAIVQEIEEQISAGELYCASTRRKDNKQLREFNPTELKLERTYKEYEKIVIDLIANAAEYGDFGYETKLRDACKSGLSGGKYLRAIILMETSRCCCCTKDKVTDPAEAALFLEYIHASSLILDDMPAFDNDEKRRGKPSIHVEYGISTAYLASTTLMSTGFQNLCRQIDWLRNNRKDIKNADRVLTKITSLIAHALGPYGLSGGQFVDISTESPLDNMDKYIKLMHEKTAVMFELAFCIGWIISNGNMSKFKEIQEIGRNIGVAYQIADDIDDMESDLAQAERQGRIDVNFANKYGRRVALMEFNKYKNGAIFLMKQNGLYSKLWEDDIFPMFTPANES